MKKSAGTDGVNPDADAWKFDFRIYHDAWLLEEKLAGVYGAIVKGSDVSFIDIEGGSYDLDTSTFTKGGVTYDVRTEGTTNLIKGIIPYADASAALGLDAGNRLTLRLVNSAISAQNDLPSGVIVKALKADGTWQTYDKTAFEADGSLVHIFNVNNNRVAIYKVTWAAGVETTYIFDTTAATLAAE